MEAAPREPHQRFKDGLLKPLNSLTPRFQESSARVVESEVTSLLSKTMQQSVSKNGALEVQMSLIGLTDTNFSILFSYLWLALWRHKMTRNYDIAHYIYYESGGLQE